MGHKTAAFEVLLAVTTEQMEFMLHHMPTLAWDDFLLNPRRLRGSDFLMRWSQGVWSEERLIQAINTTTDYYAIPYGPSGTAPDHDVRQFELYFERLEAAGLGKIKRPDLLLFHKTDQSVVDGLIESYGGLGELPFIAEPDLSALLDRALLAVECENSLWKAEQMPDYHTPLRKQKRLGDKLGLRKNAVLPTIILKEEDLEPLQSWQDSIGIPIHIWHVFFDRAYGIAFDRICELIEEGTVEPFKQVFQAPGGGISHKTIYKTHYHHAYNLGRSIDEPILSAQSIIDKNGHILPYVTFTGGTLQLDQDALAILARQTKARGKT
ncbi:MAG: AccI family restriction endonuclease [Oscillochloridaceae bacterium umkhey_bin13]